jgi:hypothetical protein
VVVYRTFDSVEANALAGSLEQSGVDAHVVGDFLDGGYPGLRLGGNAAVEIWVPADQRDVAAPLLAAWVAEHHSVEIQRTSKFQFSMQAVLIVMTLAALYMGAAAADPPVSDVALVGMELILIVGAIAFLVRRWMRERAVSDDGDEADGEKN